MACQVCGKDEGFWSSIRSRQQMPYGRETKSLTPSSNWWNRSNDWLTLTWNIWQSRAGVIT
jgi:hypothetical protein